MVTFLIIEITLICNFLLMELVLFTVGYNKGTNSFFILLYFNQIIFTNLILLNFKYFDSLSGLLFHFI